MLIKTMHLTVNRDMPGNPVERESEEWINPDKIDWIYFWRDGLYAGVNIGAHGLTVYEAEARRMIDHINGPADAFAPSSTEDRLKSETVQWLEDMNKRFKAPVDAQRLVHVDIMTLDSFYSKTAQAARRMWRCTSEEGISFNIFDHVDHRNTYKLFQDAGLGKWMDDMADGDSLDWNATPIPVYLQQNGDFFNPVMLDEFVLDMLKPIHILPENDE